MRMTFDAGEPGDALRRVRLAKMPGRKHMHQARGRAREKQRMTPILRERQKQAKLRKFRALVAAYWRGEVETFPVSPATRI